MSTSLEVLGLREGEPRSHSQKIAQESTRCPDSFFLPSFSTVTLVLTLPPPPPPSRGGRREKNFFYSGSSRFRGYPIITLPRLDISIPSCNTPPPRNYPPYLSRRANLWIRSYPAIRRDEGNEARMEFNHPCILDKGRLCFATTFIPYRSIN